MLTRENFPVCGIIPHIKRLAPHTTRIIFRSHIEIRADLIRDNPDGPQACTWKYVYYAIWEHTFITSSH